MLIFISFIIVWISSILGVISDDNCQFTSAAYMPDEEFFLSKDDKFWITKEGAGLSNPESITEKCKSSNLIRADIAVWWGQHPDDYDCNVGDQRTIYKRSFLFIEKSNDGTCKWCFLWGYEERKDTSYEDKLLTKWMERARPLCEGFEGISMMLTYQIQIAAIHRKNLNAELIYWNCEGQAFDSHLQNESIPFTYDKLYQKHFGIPTHENDSRLLTIYSEIKGNLTFVFRNGNRLKCQIGKQVFVCEPTSNLLYDQLNVCKRSSTSEETTGEIITNETPITITEEITSETVSGSESGNTIKDSTEPRAKSNLVVIIAVAFIALTCLALILVGIIVILKKLLAKKELEDESSSFKSEVVSERSATDSGSESGLVVKSEIKAPTSI